MSAYEERRQEEEKYVLKQLLYSIPLAFMAVIIPILSFFGVFLPEGQTIELWFQRSGSLSVLFAVLTEYKLFRLHGYLYPTGIITEDGDRFREKYGLFYNSLAIVSAIMALGGTFIWGYGDLLI